ncbi:Kelch-like [Sarracenia purpurea var. burkii]
MFDHILKRLHLRFVILLGRDDLSAGHFGLPSYETYENEVYDKRAEYDEYEENGLSTSANSNDEYDKLRKFLANGDFYDITVRVEEKSYKLHRVVLESKCGYFADIFRTEYNESVAKCNGIPATFPYKDEEYLLDEVDQSTFDAVIDHVYLIKISETNSMTLLEFSRPLIF